MAKQDCFVSGILARVLQVNKWLGLAPLRFEKSSAGWRITYTPIPVFIARVFVCAISGLQLWNLFYTVDYSRTGTESVSYILEAMTGYLPCIIAIFSTPGHMRCIINTLNEVKQINQKLNYYNWPQPLSKKQKICFLLVFIALFSLSVTITTVMIKSYSDIKNQPWLVVVNLANFFDDWNMLMSITQFLFLVLHIRSTFTIVNERLETLLKDPQSNTEDSPKLVKKLCLAYSSSCDVISEVDEEYGQMLMVYLSTLFLQFITAPYNLIAGMVALFASENKDLNMSIMQVFRCVLHVTKLFMLIEPCHATHTEMQRTNDLVNQLLRRVASSYEPLTVELEQFRKHIVLLEVSYSPMNVASLSRGLVLTILGSVTTYLVILVQF